MKRVVAFDKVRVIIVNGEGGTLVFGVYPLNSNFYTLQATSQPFV